MKEKILINVVIFFSSVVLVILTFGYIVEDYYYYTSKKDTVAVIKSMTKESSGSKPYKITIEYSNVYVNKLVECSMQLSSRTGTYIEENNLSQIKIKYTKRSPFDIYLYKERYPTVIVCLFHAFGFLMSFVGMIMFFFQFFKIKTNAV